MDDPTKTPSDSDEPSEFTPSGTRKVRADDQTVTATEFRTPADFAMGSQPDFSGKTFGAYQLVRKIAEGGMGVVYEATQTKLDRRVALKILNDQLASRPEFLQRFLREAKAAGALNHPNLVQVYDFMEVEGRHCLIMEYIEGEDLSVFVAREGKFTVPEGLELVEQAAQALKFACSKSIIHRDIKPSNLMLTSDGRVKVADLGLAKVLTEDTELTMTSVGIGSPHFIAPEQAQDARRVDHRVDIYALGITLLFLLTGKRPYDGGTPFSVVLAHVNQPLPSGAELGTPLPPPVEALLRKMAAKNPEDRYQDYDSLLADLQRVKAGFAPVAAAQPSNQFKKLALLGGIVAATVIIALVVMLMQKHARGHKNKISVVAKAEAQNAETKIPEPQKSDSPPAAPTPPLEEMRPEPPDLAERPGPPDGEGPPPDAPRRPPGRDSGGIRLPMGVPPVRHFFTIPEGPTKTMLAYADNYAAQHPDSYEELLDGYEQVKQKADESMLRELDRKISSIRNAEEKALADAFSQREAKMQEKIAAGKLQDAFNVWADFPTHLRNREVDEKIRQLLKKSFPQNFSPAPPRR